MTNETKVSLVYFLGNTMYINVTNLCTCNCVFCVRSIKDTVGGANLKLEKENVTAEQIIEELKQNSPEKSDEIVFCGYGEPLIKLDIVKQVAKYIKDNYPNMPIRVNTNGHANMVHKRDVVPELIGLIDRISISLNSDNPEQYGELTACKFDKEETFNNVKEFISKCQKSGIDTTATIVVGFKDYKVNIEGCKEIAESLGAKFKVREWLEEGYN